MIRPKKKIFLDKEESKSIKDIEEQMSKEGINLKYSDDKVRYGSKKLGIDFDIMFYIHHTWFRNSNNTLSEWNRVKNLRIPTEFKKPNKSSIYRGFYLSEKAIERFEQGKDIRIDPDYLCSWTEHKGVAEIFTYDHGVIIERPTSSLDIWVCLEKLYPYLGKYKDRYTQGMKEILVKGTGLVENIITPDMVIWSKFTR